MKEELKIKIKSVFSAPPILARENPKIFLRLAGGRWQGQVADGRQKVLALLGAIWVGMQRNTGPECDPQSSGTALQTYVPNARMAAFLAVAAPRAIARPLPIRSRRKEANPNSRARNHTSTVPPTANAKILPDLTYCVAPMVGASDLAFRLLCRKYGATVAYTPMFYSERFASDAEYRKESLQSCELDHPLVVQFCGNDPETMLKAAKLVEDECEGIDINLGCPQREARNMRYGAYLLDECDRPLVLHMVNLLASSLKVPVSCKIRLLDGHIDNTVAFAKQLEAAGCSWITVHGRARGNPLQRRHGPADLEAIKCVASAVSIPVVSNGNVRGWLDVRKNLNLTGSAGIMSAEGILQNPAIFNGSTGPGRFHLAYEYLKLAAKYKTPLAWAARHVNKMCKFHVMKHDMHDSLFACSTMDDLQTLVQRLHRMRDSEASTIVMKTMERRENDTGSSSDGQSTGRSSASTCKKEEGNTGSRDHCDGGNEAHDSLCTGKEREKDPTGSTSLNEPTSPDLRVERVTSRARKFPPPLFGGEADSLAPRRTKQRRRLLI